MGIITKAMERRFNLSATNAFSHLVDWGMSTHSGVSVTEENALKYSAVYACVRILSKTVASLPLITYLRTGDKEKERATKLPLYTLLHDQPNPFMSSFDFRQTLQSHLALWGNGYAEIQYNGSGKIVALWPLRPDKMEKVSRGANGLVYRYRLPNGEPQDFPQEKIFHLRGLASDGIVGYSPIALARQAVGLGLATETFGAKFFGNDARPGGILSHPGELGEEAHGRLRDSWQSRHGGLSNSHNVAILEEGMKYDQIGIPPEEAQFLETRKFQIQDIARIYDIPLHMLGDLDRATFSNIEHQSIQFVTHTIRPWLVSWEQAISLQLMSKRDRERYFSEFLVAGLLRGDTTSRYAAYATGRQNGWLSANDIRALENMNPIPDGDVYLVPLNMIPASDAGEEQQQPEEQPARMVRTRNGGEMRASQKRAAGLRHRLFNQFLPMYEDVAGRVMRREANDVGNAARRLIPQSIDGFKEWAGSFYEEHATFISRQFEPLTETYTSQVTELTAAEVGRDTPTLTGFVNSYVSMMGERIATRNHNRLIREIDKAETPETALSNVDALMVDWRELRPSTIARDEGIRANNGIALAAYRAFALSFKTWVTFGENCPYCDSLDGRSIGVENHFIHEGESYQPEGADVPLVTSGNIGHAPAHRGCDCMIVAGI